MRSRLRIITPAFTQDLTTLETARAELGVEANTSNDENITRMIHEMSSVVAGYCGRVFGEETVEETFWPTTCGESLGSVVLARKPVSAFTSIILDGRELGTSEFDLDERAGIIYFMRDGCSCACRWFRSLVVTYTGGYVLLDNLPEAIERACLIMVKDQYNAIGRDPSMRSESIPGVHSYTLAGGGSETAGALSASIAQLLAPYKRWPI